MNRKLIIGTRGSQLAMWQANHIKDRLAAAGIDSELKVIKTQGDIIQHLRLDKLEGKGFFTKELEEELLSSTIDLAVHSHKDLPTVNPPGLIIAAVSERESPAELLIVLKDCVDIKKRLSLKHNATVGTSSNRRKAQLLSLRPDLEFDDLRGNLQTRIQKLRDENYDAIILAKAGVERIDMDLSEFYVEEIPPVELIPAPAQGVLAIQIRESDQELYEALQVIHNKEVAEVIAIERKVLNLFDAGCHALWDAIAARVKANMKPGHLSQIPVTNFRTGYISSVILRKEWQKRSLQNLPKTVNFPRLSLFHGI